MANIVLAAALPPGLRELPVKYAKIDCAAANDNAIVAAVTGKSIVVVGYELVASSAVSVTWRSATTALSGAMALAANGGISRSYSPCGWFMTAAGAALNLYLSAAIQVSGDIAYVEI